MAQKTFKINGVSDSKVRLLGDESSKTSYTFAVTRRATGAYGIFLLFGAPSTTSGYMYIGVISSADVVYFIPILPIENRTLSATYEDGNLTITADQTLWGGCRIIWMG